ncbi:unnamed protein product [Brachionus calyciflorus]|uniref:Uncharacterized protein n=1 Tax=Brachionus calyciflorus TaxID=104777 RepID=A0A814A0W0_9BILA|nr:unnamed protein product [Brachionus calyciflorus]
MFKLRQELIEYFDGLKNQVDVECEEKLNSDKDITQFDKDNYGKMRQRLIEEIDSCFINSINILKKNDQIKQIDEIKFDRFCFFIKNHKDYVQKIFHKTLGILIITNEFVSIDSQLTLASKYFFLKQDDTNAKNNKDLVMADILYELINTKKRLSQSDFIFDLSDKKKNKLNELNINFPTLGPIEPSDFDPLVNMLDFCNFKELTLESDRTVCLSPNSFSNLNNLEKIILYCPKKCTFQSNCFDGLLSLRQLSILHITNILLDKTMFNGLDNLKSLYILDKTLKLNNCSIDTLEICRIENLKYLYLQYNRLTNLFSDNLINLDNIKSLNLQSSFISNYDAGNLNVLKSLEFLNLSNQKHRIINLDKLDLPNLKFLIINSVIVPKFKLKLEFLNIKDLLFINNHSFNHLASLKGLCLELKSDSFKKLNKIMFSKMENLVHLQMNFDNLDIKYLELNKNVYEQFFNKPQIKFTFSKGLKFNMQFSCYKSLVEFFKKEFISKKITFDVLEFISEIL